MEQWRAELQRKPLSMSEGQACEALGLTPGPDGRVEEDDMRRAYRALARRCVEHIRSEAGRIVGGW
jgi:DnaJ family protein C protein 13